MVTPLFVPLATDPYRRFERGTKTVEIRARDSPVARALINRDEGCEVTLSRGYSTPDRMTGKLGLWVEAPTLADLPLSFVIAADLPPPAERATYFRNDVPVLAFQVLELPMVREAERGAE